MRTNGSADIEASNPLEAFLDALHLEACRLAVRETIFVMHDLYFINSSCLSLFVRRISDIVASGGPRLHVMRFRGNPNLRWQQKSVAALSALADGTVIVE